MAKVVQLEIDEKPPDSPLTPELKHFIDRVIVPTLVREYLAELDEGSDERVFHMDDENEPAKPGDTMKNCKSATATPSEGVSLS